MAADMQREIRTMGREAGWLLMKISIDNSNDGRCYGNAWRAGHRKQPPSAGERNADLLDYGG